jgi:hypothetical protein
MSFLKDIFLVVIIGVVGLGFVDGLKCGLWMTHQGLEVGLKIRITCLDSLSFLLSIGKTINFQQKVDIFGVTIDVEINLEFILLQWKEKKGG